MYAFKAHDVGSASFVAQSLVLNKHCQVAFIVLNSERNHIVKKQPFLFVLEVFGVFSKKLEMLPIILVLWVVKESKEGAHMFWHKT